MSPLAFTCNVIVIDGAHHGNVESHFQPHDLDDGDFGEME